MPKGPKGQKRPADVVSNAIKVARIATGEEDEAPMTKKVMDASEMGKKGGAARAKSLSAKKRSEIAKKAAKKRWENAMQD